MSLQNNRINILITILFIISMLFAFWLINFDEMIKAFIGIGIINIWFFGILYFYLIGKIKFADDEENDNDNEKQI